MRLDRYLYFYSNVKPAKACTYSIFILKHLRGRKINVFFIKKSVDGWIDPTAKWMSVELKMFI